MSEWSRSTDEQNGRLESLVAQLRQENGSSNAPGTSFLTQMAAQTNPFFTQPQQQQHAYNPLAAPSPLQTPPAYDQHSRNSSLALSPTGDLPQIQQRPMVPTGSNVPSNADRTANLLNLLKFSQPASLSSPNIPITVPRPTSRDNTTGLQPATGHGAPDLLATLMGTSYAKENKQSMPQIPFSAPHASGSSDPIITATGPSADTQAYLLQLLNRPKPAQSEPKLQHEPMKPYTSSARASPVSDVSGLSKALEETSIGKGIEEQADPSQAASKSTHGLFTYVNPFEQLAASSPRNRTPKSSTAARSSTSTPAMQILKPPRHTTAESSELKRKVDQGPPSLSPAHSKRKLASSSSTPSPLLDGRSQIEAHIGIGATKKPKETVAEALSGVGDQVDKQVEEALARAEEDESRARAEAEQTKAIIEQDVEKMMNAKTESDFEITAQVAAMDIKKELDKKGNEHVLKDSLPASVAEAIKDLVDETAEGRIADSWESADAEDSPIKTSSEPFVKVFNFPLKPFVSLTLHPNAGELPEFRADSFMDVARLKKDFDQIDRTLVAASNNFIIYAMKNGGFRAIRQADGRDDKLFTKTVDLDGNEGSDRIFNVSLSFSHSDATETMIGTGVSGTVYWAPASNSNGELYVGRTDPEKLGFALPPFKAMGEESSGGVVKTRARKSSGHPEFFAVGRGKSIHIIWPSVITKQGYLRKSPERVVDTEKYLNHRSLKINTGKAGKDFTFSQDDTTIVSLDKAGRVKFWDVRTLTNTDRGTEARYPTPEQIQPVEINEPLMTLVTTPANEKSWPTSVLLIDKLRAYQKGGALRYLIVGMKQNHTLQLWDLALGKQVQELHLPHEKESDAVCSVVYHPSTGMIIVGHPTRNSIYFIHVSAPRYNMQKTTSQAEFAEKLAAADAALPKPDATAVMSGIREYSFGNKGILRSLDIVPSPASASSDNNDPSLFELYAMHSKGVTCITIKQQDLGWNKEMKVMYPINAEKEGLVSAESLKPIQGSEADVPMPSPSARSVASSRATAKESLAKDAGRKLAPSNGHTEFTRAPETSASSSRAVVKQEPPQISAVNGGQEASASGAEKSDKKRKKKPASTARGHSETLTVSASTSTEAAMQAPPGVPSPPEVAKDINTEQLSVKETAHNASLLKSSTEISSIPDFTTTSNTSTFSQSSIDAIIKKMEGSVSSELSNLLTGSMDDLYRRIDDDKRTQASVADAKQDAMLRLVASTLSDNVEKTLSGIVVENMKNNVLPVISDVAMKAVNDQLGSKLASHLRSALPKELQGVLPDVLTKALQKPEVLKLMSETLAKTVAFRVEEQFSNLLKSSITPAFTDLAMKAIQQASSDIQRQAMGTIAKIEHERRADGIKIDQLSTLVTRLSETVSTMAGAQSNFQGEFLKLQQAAHARMIEQPPSQSGTRMSRPPSQTVAQIQEADPLQRVVEEIASAVNDGDLDTAVMRWIKSDRVQEVFEKYFSKFDPAVIRGVNPLMLLSLGVTISSQFEGVLMYQRLDWVETILQALQSSTHALEPEVREVTPKIMTSIVGFLEHLFMRISGLAAQDPLLKRLAVLISTAREIIDTSHTPFDARRSSFGANVLLR